MDKKEKNTQEENIKNVENIEEINEDEYVDEEPEYVTREINLDDLYDGSINNTVVIDPITKNEILLENKKNNFTIIGIVIAILILLTLYYVNNKTDFGNTTKDVEPMVTTTKKSEGTAVKNGTLTCSYSSKSDAESETVTFTANYENSKILSTKFNFVTVSNTDVESAVINDLKSQYENFFINNVAVSGHKVSFEKNDKGFTFNIETDYNNADFDNLVVTEGQTILYLKPNKTDSIDSLKDSYTNKGFSCLDSTSEATNN